VDYTNLGRTGLSVSRLCLGTMNFGKQTDEITAFAIMDQAHEAGINLFDTANVYGHAIEGGDFLRHEGKGASEEIIGRWLAQGGGRRQRIVLATKVYTDMGDWPNEGKLSALNIKNACDGSLRRLQTDYIDLYQMHHVDRAAPWDEIWEAMDTLRHQGKILYVGSSNFAGWHIAKAQEAARRRHFLGLVSEQCVYNLVVRDVERDVIPAAQDYGLGIFAWSPLHGGVLGGMARRPQEGNRRQREEAKERLETRRPQIERYEDLCDEIGAEPSTVGLAWLLGRPSVTAPIVGPRTLEQLVHALHALDLDLDDNALGRLDELFPGYRTSPEDFAW
jgi:aryl-alcohol dehydrogenase-like predicted oxidoreductase